MQVEETETPEFIVLPPEGLPLTELAERVAQSPGSIISYFFAEKSRMLTVNDVLERDLCEQVCEKFEIEWIDEDEKESAASDRGFLKEEYEDATPRPPVVTVMGHVDHGKTTLLDTIRQRSVAATEAGGITQRIGAYTVKVGDQKATFIDTPGHEAFTSMRARGAQVTDIAILVVAADDGVMPQTREAIAHARAAEVPIIVAINKIDVPNAQPDKTRQNLSEEGLISEEWGGDIPMVECSAKKNIGIDNLLEIVTLTAQVGELTAKQDGAAAGVVLESTFETQRGSLATLLIQRGTLQLGDVVVSGSRLGRVRTMQNEAGTNMKDVGPSTAVQVSGWQEPPEAGDQFEVYADMKVAREAAAKALKENEKKAPRGFTGISGEDSAMRLALLLKTDAQGSIAAVQHMFNDVKDSKYVNLRWVLAAPGPITDSDIELAAACPVDQRAMVVGFNTQAMPSAMKAAKAKGVEVRTFKVIYELFETIVGALENEIGPEEQYTEKGEAQVLAVFNAKDGKIAGCRVVQGVLTKGHTVKVYRGGKVVGQGPIISLREGKAAVTEVDEGNECGFGIQAWDAWQPGDKVISFEVAMIPPQIVPAKRK